jgi:MFS family permease
MSLSFFLTYTAFSGIQNLSSSAIGDKGSIGLGLLYAVFTLNCTAGPKIVQTLGVKVTLAGSFAIITVYSIFLSLITTYPDKNTLNWVLVIVGNFFVGLAASALWTAQGAYVTGNAELYAKAKGQPMDASLGTFNGIFFCIFQSTQLSANLSGSLLPKAFPTMPSLTFIVFSCCAAGGAILASTLRNIETEPEAATSVVQAAQNMLGLVWKSHTLKLLVPLMMFSGVQVSACR